MERQPAVIFDRDGTLFSVKHHMGENGPNSWRSYNGLCAFDAPVPVVAALFHSIRPGVAKIITSGRDGAFRPGIVAACIKHDIIPTRLLMRSPNDRRLDSVVKLELYERHIEPFYEVLYVIDDRQQVVDMWRSIGLSVLQVVDPGILPRICSHGDQEMHQV